MEKQYYELRSYRLLHRGKTVVIDDYLERAALPAYERLGIGPVGVFRGVYGPAATTIQVLLPHPSFESVVESRERLLADPAYLEAGAPFLEAPLSDPAYVRVESSLMAAFDRMPRIELPKGNLDRGPRIFELRIYEGHSVRGNKKKIEMFNEGGEIEIFRRTGLQPVLFGETLVGSRMPNLTYMLTFDGMAQRDEAWRVFGADPGWIALRDDPRYADTVSNITDLILKPTGYSQM